MKTVSLVVISMVFMFGLFVGYLIGGFDSSSKPPFYLVDIYRTDGQKVSLPITEADSKFFFFPTNVGIKNLLLRHPNE